RFAWSSIKRSKAVEGLRLSSTTLDLLFRVRRVLNDLPHDPVLHRGISIEPAIAGGVFFDPLEWLSGFPRKNPIQPVAHAKDFAGLGIDVAGRAPGPDGGVVPQKASVRA